MVFVLELPAPAGGHGLDIGIRPDGFRAALPGAHDGTVAKESILVGTEWLTQGLAQEHGVGTGGIDVQVGSDGPTGLQAQASYAALVLLYFHRATINDWDAALPDDGFQVSSEL